MVMLSEDEYEKLRAAAASVLEHTGSIEPLALPVTCAEPPMRAPPPQDEEDEEPVTFNITTASADSLDRRREDDW